jgi:hypothetical protein
MVDQADSKDETMQAAKRCGFLLVLALIAASCGGAEVQDASGAAGRSVRTAAAAKKAPGVVRYASESEPGFTLSLTETAKGEISGTLSSGGSAMPVMARRDGKGFAGTVGPNEGALPFTAIEKGDAVVLYLGTGDQIERITFHRIASGPTAQTPQAAAGARNVVKRSR